MALSSALARTFASLLQEGFYCFLAAPVSIRDFLLGLPGFSADYIENAVQTIFHNGVATDSLDTPLRAGDTLALSAAMPGLAGAIFRREGIHASLRSTVEEPAHPASNREGFILVKLYNNVGADRIVDILRHGVRLSSGALTSFFKRRADLSHQPMRIFHEGHRIAIDQLLDLVSTRQQVELTLLPG
ncbi:hypothetical protein JCM15519_25760 [Fundidesulfovibrio butyratiphilus]